MDLEIWARSLADHLQHHMDSERGVLIEYEKLAQEIPDERVAYLLRLIVDDERRHHRLFEEMVTWLRAQTESRPLGGPMVPSHRAAISSDERERLRHRTEELLAFEREDMRELRELNEVVEQVEDTAWWTALIETMEHDTRKHIALVEFIRSSL